MALKKNLKRKPTPAIKDVKTSLVTKPVVEDSESESNEEVNIDEF